MCYLVCCSLTILKFFDYLNGIFSLSIWTSKFKIKQSLAVLCLRIENVEINGFFYSDVARLKVNCREARLHKIREDPARTSASFRNGSRRAILVRGWKEPLRKKEIVFKQRVRAWFFKWLLGPRCWVHHQLFGSPLCDAKPAFDCELCQCRFRGQAML